MLWGTLVAPEWVAENFLLVHLLDTRESPAEHIPSAVHLPLSSLEEAMDQMDRECRLVLIADGDDSSERAAELLETLGFEHVCRLAGGMERWRKEGRPCLEGPPPPPTAEHRRRRRVARDQAS